MKRLLTTLSLLLLTACGSGTATTNSSDALAKSVPSATEASYVVLTIHAPGAQAFDFYVEGAMTTTQGQLPDTEFAHTAALAYANSQQGSIHIVAIDLAGLDGKQFVIYGTQVGAIDVPLLKIIDGQSQPIPGTVEISNNLK